MTKLSELRELRKSLFLGNGTLAELQNILDKLESLNLDGLDDVFDNYGIVYDSSARNLIQLKIERFANNGYFNYVESLCYDLKMLDDFPDERFWIINEYRRLERLNEAAVEDVLDELIDSRN